MRRGRKTEELSPALKALRTVVTILVLFVVFAYATEATNINLEEPLEPKRQETALRALRALARPDFFTYYEENRTTDILIRMPCPESIQGAQTTQGERVVILSPNCASTTQEVLTLTGSGFRPRTSGIIRWHPPGEVATTRALTSFRTDLEGNFVVSFSMPDIRPTDEPQRIEVDEKWQTGISGLSEASKTTIEKILETILLALLATTVGTLLSIPLSFLAARNLMENVGSPLAAVMAGIIALPIAYIASREIMSAMLQVSTLLGQPWLMVVVLAIVIVAVYAVMNVGSPLFNTDEVPTGGSLLITLRFFAFFGLLMFGMALLGDLGMIFGNWLAGQLGSWSFMGSFIELSGEFIQVLSPATVGFLVAFVAMSWGSHFGQEAILRLGTTFAKVITVVLAGLGTAVIIYGFGSALNWLYVFDVPAVWTTYPALIGGAIAAVATALLWPPNRPVPIGLIIYTSIRSILNVIRSIEPLVYVIIFAVWVGIGPFAGVLALTLHTIASLGKLFSEQVENISEGPLEAITATGANRLQTIVFAVIPQIVPPYIAFTLYRWDINVRMSTIIGFGGGGGIGFVLAQAINLLQYRQASVMMIAIAIVVGTLDYVSSKVRSRIL